MAPSPARPRRIAAAALLGLLLVVLTLDLDEAAIPR